MMDMSMYFRFTYHVENLFFKNLSISTPAGMFGAVVVFIILGILYEGIRFVRKLYMHWMEKQKENYVVESDTSTLNEQTPQLPLYKWIQYNGIQSLFHMLQVITGYFLMLAVMTYNAWLAIGVILGATSGFFIFGTLVPYLEIRQSIKSSKSYSVEQSSVATSSSIS